METTGKVKRKPMPLEYIKYDGGNMDAIQEFTGIPGVCKLDKIRIAVPDSASRMFIVSPDMYVVKNEDGQIAVYTKKMFEQKFSSWSFMDDIPRMLLYSHRHCGEDECFVMDYPHQMMATDKIPMKKKRCDLTDADNYIRCVICHEPATQLDHLFPNDTMDNRCSKHAKSLIDPCAWEDYGTAVEVCSDHYSLLALKDKMEACIDWIEKSDMHLTENVLRDKLIEAGRQLNFFMMAKWPDEQMGPKKEGEQK